MKIRWMDFQIVRNLLVFLFDGDNNQHEKSRLLFNTQLQNINLCLYSISSLFNHHMENSSNSQLNHPETNNKTIYIISPNFKASHIQSLIQQLTARQIPIQMQTQTDSLGNSAKSRTFVLVDNIKGVVTLGSEFSSLLMFIVGYPKKGRNKKNHYCRVPAQVIQKYEYYCTLPVYEKKIYNCSSVVSRPRIASEKSAMGSIKSKSNRQSINSKFSNSSEYFSKQIKRNLTKEIKKDVDKNSKLFLYVQSKDKYFVKYAWKIAANNAIKYKTVDNVEDLALSLEVCRSSKNYILVDYDVLSTVINISANLKCVVYCTQEINASAAEYLLNNPKIVSLCRNQKEIVDSLRQIGFSAVSLKDIDKSIVRYHNPFATQRQVQQRDQIKKSLKWISSDNENQKKIQMHSEISISQNITQPIHASSDLQKSDEPPTMLRKKKITKFIFEQSQSLNQLIDQHKNTQQGIIHKNKENNEYCLVQPQKKEVKKKIRKINSKGFNRTQESSRSLGVHSNSSSIKKVHKIKFKPKGKRVPKLQTDTSMIREEKENIFMRNESMQKSMQESLQESMQKSLQESIRVKPRSLRSRSAEPAYFIIPQKQNGDDENKGSQFRIQGDFRQIKRKRLIPRQQYFISNIRSNKNKQTPESRKIFSEIKNTQSTRNSSDINNIHINPYEQQLLGLFNKKIQPVYFLISKCKNFEIEFSRTEVKSELMDSLYEYQYQQTNGLKQICKSINNPKHKTQFFQQKFIFLIDEENLEQDLDIINKKLIKSLHTDPSTTRNKVYLFIIQKNCNRVQFKNTIKQILNKPKVKTMLSQNKTNIEFKPICITDYHNYVKQIVKSIM